MVKFSNRKRVAELTKLELLTRSIISLALIAIVTGGWAWWHFVHNDPKRVFWSAIDNAFQTNSYSRQTVQGETAQSLNQKVYVNTSPRQLVYGTNEVIQTGQDALYVVTDVAGDPTSDFVKYNLVNTSQKNAQGKPQDYSSILGIWGTTASSTDSSITDGQLYNQSVLGVLPFANLRHADRKDMIKLIMDKQVYNVDFSKTTRKIVSSRPVYTYDVTVGAESYITMLKKYASLVGLTQLAQTNPADFKETSPLKFQFSIDVWTQQITKINYVNGSREEIYGSFGLRSFSDLPKNAIPVQELQQRVQDLE